MTNGTKLHAHSSLLYTLYVAILQHKEHAPNNNTLVLFLFHVTIPSALSIDRFLSFDLATQKNPLALYLEFVYLYVTSYVQMLTLLLC